MGWVEESRKTAYFPGTKKKKKQPSTCKKNKVTGGKDLGRCEEQEKLEQGSGRSRGWTDWQGSYFVEEFSLIPCITLVLSPCCNPLCCGKRDDAGARMKQEHQSGKQQMRRAEVMGCGLFGGRRRREMALNAIGWFRLPPPQKFLVQCT